MELYAAKIVWLFLLITFQLKLFPPWDAKDINSIRMFKLRWATNDNINQMIFSIDLFQFVIWHGLIKTTGGRLTKIHLIEIVFFQLIQSLIIS